MAGPIADGAVPLKAEHTKAAAAREKLLWQPRAVAAEIVGLSPRQFDDVFRPRLPADATRGAGASLRYRLPAVVAALVAYRIEQVQKPVDDEADPLMTGGASPALERYRRLKGDDLERTLAERDGQLVRKHVILDALRQGMSVMRATGDRLVRQFGNDAGDVFNEGVSEFEAAIVKAGGGNNEPV